MKKISQISWKRYLESAEGKAAVRRFTSICNRPTANAIIDFVKLYDSDVLANYGKAGMKKMEAICQLFLDDAAYCAERFPIDNQEEFNDLYLDLLADYSGASQCEPQEVKQQMFRPIMSDNVLLTSALYCHFPKFCVPNLFAMQYHLMLRLADKYELELPQCPKQVDYIGRCAYYLELNDVLCAFAEENGIESKAELCAFLYDYELPLLREQAEQEAANEDMPEASQVWLISGNYKDGERNMEHGFWQANAEIKRGDILVFYEKAPTKAINSIWRAESDGCYDPFFYYSSYTFIGHKIQIPPISIETLRDHSYFSTHPMVTGNFERLTQKHFNSEDYSQLKDILTQKGFDCSILPKLKAHEAPSDIDFSEKEGAVHKYLVLPLLESMGWTEENGHVLNQVVQHVGRGESRTNGRTDVSLHPYGQGLKKAKVVIEEKYWMRNESERLDAFEQGLSYARLSESNMLVICDKAQIVVFPKTRDSFSFDKSHTFYWDEMQNPDKFCKLRKLLS